MTARVRKAIGGLGIVVVLFAWMWAAATVGVHVPRQSLFEMAYYVVVGIGWSLPVIPLVIWMNRGR